MEDVESIGEIIDEKFGNLKNNSGDIITCNEEKEKKWGGPRENSGRPLGKMNKNTLTKLAIKKKMQERIAAMADKLITAQASLATGVQMLFVIRTDAKGNRSRPELVTDEETIIDVLEALGGASGTLEDDNSEYFFMTTTKPDNQAIEALLNRTFGKATEKIEIEGGFFKADTLNINIVAPIKELEEKVDNIIEIEPSNITTLEI